MKNPNRFDLKRLRLDHIIQRFFGANALLSIIVLALITLFLFREGAGFFPLNLQNIRNYRLAGLEYVEPMRDQVNAHTTLNRRLQDLRMRQMKALLTEAANAHLAKFDRFTASLDISVKELRGVVSETILAAGQDTKAANVELAKFDEFTAAFSTSVKGLRSVVSKAIFATGQNTEAANAELAKFDEFTASTNRSLLDLRMRQMKALLATGKDTEAANAGLAKFDKFIAAFDSSVVELRDVVSEALLAAGKDVEAANAELAGFDQFTAAFDSSVDELRSVVSDLTDTVTAIKDKAKIREDALEQQQFLLSEGKQAEADAVKVTEIDFAKELEPVKAVFPLYQKTSLEFRGKLETLLLNPPTLPVKALQPRFDQFQKAARAYVATFPSIDRELKEWKQFAPVPWYRAVTSFLFGREWITNSFWQDWYGVLPLLTGSLLVSAIALIIAVPMGVCAAIYVSELASPAEQHFIKPYIEFISAIPSVVLGFFGIAVLGETLRAVSQWEALSWISAFPIAERLNAFTAGCLLALMAVPTIFTLSEDALNSVPRAFKEASYALGATRLQTVFRILVPASLSGIISAVLLGFGRVIGETMVVLLCAGNRIEIPNFTEGMSAFFQPVHTMTGIVAQELGEVANGTIHYRALFMVGLLLFVLALVINWLAQAAVRRFKVSIG